MYNSQLNLVEHLTPVALGNPFCTSDMTALEPLSSLKHLSSVLYRSRHEMLHQKVVSLSPNLGLLSLITVYAGQTIWWCERCLCQPTQNFRCVHWDLLRTTREPQMHKHRNSNVIRHLFPTRQIYAHKSFPTLCFGGFIAIIGHLCHSHPVPSLGKNLTGLNFWSHWVFSCSVTFF